MLYLTLCSLVMLVAAVSLHKHMFQMIDFVHSVEGARPNPLPALFPILSAVAFSAPVLVLFFGDLFVEPEQGQPINYGRTQIYFLLAGSLACLAMGFFAARMGWKEGKIGFWATGRLVVLLLAGIVGAIPAYQHLTFFSSDQGGVANVGILREIADLGDMERCISAVALVQFRDAGPINYRCPTALIFNRDSHQPFTPWPEYVEGTSQDLADAIMTVKDASEHGYSLQKLEK